MSIVMVEPANESTRIDSTEQLLRAKAQPEYSTDGLNADSCESAKTDLDRGDLELETIGEDVNQLAIPHSNDCDGRINQAYTSPDIELQNDSICMDVKRRPLMDNSRTHLSPLHAMKSLSSARVPAERAIIPIDDSGEMDQQRQKADELRPRTKESALSEIGADYMRVNGAITSFKQLQRPTSMQSLPTSSKMSYTSEDAGIALVNVNDYQQCDEKAKQAEKIRQCSVGYRLGKRKVLYEKRKRISDYCLISGMVGIGTMILETELSMAGVYLKVSIASFFSFLAIVYQFERCFLYYHTYQTSSNVYCTRPHSLVL